jgi:peptidoglycan-associated lipoprotein
MYKKNYLQDLRFAPLFFLGFVLSLPGCSTQKIIGQEGLVKGSGHTIVMPDAATYGLIDNLAPSMITEPYSVHQNGSSIPSKDGIDAPSNQTYYFDENSVTLKPADLDSLRHQANYLIAHPADKVRLEGFSDSQGSREVNVLIAYQWLQLVNAALGQDGVAQAQIDMVSYGKEKPAVDGFGENVWAKNRKVQLVYEESL